MDETVYDLRTVLSNRPIASFPVWRIALSSALALGVVAGAAAVEPAPDVGSKGPRAWIPAAESAPTAARCVLPTGDPIPADDVLAALRAGKNVDLQGKIIEGNLDADRSWGVAAERKSSLRVVRGKLRLDSCRVTGHVFFPRTVFVQDVVLSCAEIIGDLDLTDSEVRGSLLADRAHIVGDVRLTNVNLEKDLNFKKATLGGRVDMSGANLHAVSLQESTIERSLDLSNAIAGVWDLSLAKIDGPVKLHDALLLGAFTARDTTFGRTVSLSSVSASGSIDLGGASVGGDVSLSDLATEGDLVVPETSGGSLELTSVVVGHDLSFAGGRYLDLAIKGVTVRGGSDLQRGHYTGRLLIADSDFGKTFHATGAQFSGHCEFRRVRFPGDDPMAGAQFASSPALFETKLPGFPIVSPGTESQPEPDPSDSDKP